MSDLRRILVVDDESIIVSFLQNLLTVGAAEYHIETAGSGEEALRKAEAFRPHLVVLDINIPGVDGFEVCRAIHASPACRHTVVLAMTADANPTRTRQIIDAGARECLSKPFPLKDFLAKARKYVGEAVEREAQG